MKKIFKFCFGDWKRPLLFFGLVAMVLILLEVVQWRLQTSFSFASDTLFLLYFVAVLALFISLAYQLNKKDWKKSIFTLLTLGLSIFVLIRLSISEFWIAQSAPDGYADNLTLPDAIPLSIPQDNMAELYGLVPDSLRTEARKPLEFSLFNGLQPGIYDYGIWLGKIDSGTIYLKAYEITKGERLSATSLKTSSSIPVYNPTDILRRFNTEESFTIYEGDWGNPYAARFEIWYRPNKGEERKLTSKNFKIEGWQR
jgi:hypothetical protein